MGTVLLFLSLEVLLFYYCFLFVSLCLGFLVVLYYHVICTCVDPRKKSLYHISG